MTKVLSNILVVIMLVFGVPYNSYAILTSYSDSEQYVVYDSYSEQYWYGLMNDFTGMTWNEQQTAVSELSTNLYFGLSDWHVASYNEMSMLFQNEYQEFDLTFSSTRYDSSDFGYSYETRGRYGSQLEGDNHYTARFSYSNTFGFPNNYENWKLDIEYTITSDDVASDWISVWITASNGSNTSPAPVPEPSTVVLMGLGLVGLAGMGRKKLFKK